MPDYTFTFTVRGIGPQKAGAIGTRIQNKLAEDGVDASAVNTGRITQTFRVISVDTDTREVHEDLVEATDEQAARDQVTSATRVVAMVRGGTG